MPVLSKLAAGALAVGLLGGVAHASVIYNFIPDAGSGTALAQVTGGQLVVTDAAYRSGSATFNYSGSGPVANESDPRMSPILFAGLGISPLGADEATLGSGLLGPGVTPRSEQFIYSPSQLLISDFTFNADGSLAGHMRLIGGTGDRASTHGTGTHWTVGGWQSDYYNHAPCAQGDDCFAGTGHWQLDAATIPDPITETVPEPPTWGLFALAVAGLLGLRRARA
ncbi:PEP-CTERM sorting domain-containing protein [Salinisphaera sp.]|uniref:PEP-CTERM sorting domain-containing protein n=1 Tax=Salinisphaera sp. TaxID=1914330 RepID=UPI002D76FF2C|nr:PEP-CTERM sorting domain-containing protein [Salinisphaera sp.]HET7313640.1 PEP-CTERM sorting domain-containing protein [Salinisphaera sp.]